MTTAPRVLIADDHPTLRAGVRSALEAGGCIVCAEAGTADDAVAAALRERPDVCLIDIGMPGDGITAVARITAALPETLVLMLTISADADDLFAALRGGAAGYLLKDLEPAQLPSAVRAAMAGEAPMAGALTAQLVGEYQRTASRMPLVRADGRAVALSSREWDVLELLADGSRTADIAARLFIDSVTVRRHVSRLTDKLGVSSRAEAVEMLERHRHGGPRVQPSNET